MEKVELTGQLLLTKEDQEKKADGMVGSILRVFIATELSTIVLCQLIDHHSLKFSSTF